MLRPVFSKRNYIRYSECKPGDVIVDHGVYLKSEDGKFGTPNHIFKVGGVEVVLNSAGKLNWQIDNFLAPGMVCVIKYVGKIKLEKGIYKGKETHDFEMLVDDAVVESPSASTTSTLTSDLPELMI